MGTTPVYGLRFPEGADTPDVPRDIENLALDVEAVVAAIPPPVSLDAVGNLLTANQASIETDTSGWTGQVSATLATGTNALHGTKSLKVTNGRIADCWISTSTKVAVSPSSVYTYQFTMTAFTGLTQVQLRWYEYDSGGAMIGGGRGTVNIVPAVGRTARETFTTQPNTGFVELWVVTIGTAVGDVGEFDKFGLWAGAGGEWAMPGTPIANLGTKVEHPNTDDVATYVWDAGKGRWQMEHYDSGWRRILEWTADNTFSMGTAPDTTTYSYEATGDVQIRRVGSKVTARWAGTGVLRLAAGASQSSSGELLHIPSGFGPAVSGSLPAVMGSGSVPFSFIASLTTVTRAGNTTLPAPGTYFPGSLELTWTADVPIPTTLPGTLVSPAPN